MANLLRVEARGNLGPVFAEGLLKPKDRGWLVARKLSHAVHDVGVRPLWVKADGSATTPELTLWRCSMPSMGKAQIPAMADGGT